MFASERILTLDVGASSVKIAEFHIGNGRELQLTNFNFTEISIDPEHEENRRALVIAAVQNVLREKNITPGKVVFSVPGQSVFTRFVKLPPAEESKVVQIIQYEAQQNVPFPIDEVIWDYQILGKGEDGALEVALFAIKSDIIEEMAVDVESTGLKTEMVDVAPMALYNAYRYNEGDTPECTLMVDIGARTTNLLFIEGSRIFTRAIPIAGNAITQSIASELEITFQDAERLKREKGFVALGGAYEEPPDPQQAQISKIIRHVMTRLHSEIARSINFYRTQQNGGAPTRVLLSGGSSITPYTDRFFAEKTQVPVEYFNPFRAVQVAAEVPREDLSRCAHFFGEVVGLALRRMNECPIEINLLPHSLRARKQSRQKRPYFIGAAISALLIPICLLAYSKRAVTLKEKQITALTQRVNKIQSLDNDIKKKKDETNRLQHHTDEVVDLINQRFWWPRLMEDLNQRVISNLWIVSITPSVDAAKPTTAATPPPGQKQSNIAGNNSPVITTLRIRGAGHHSDDDLKIVNDFKDSLSKSLFFEKAGVEVVEYPPLTTEPIFTFILRAKVAKPHTN